MLAGAGFAALVATLAAGRRLDAVRTLGTAAGTFEVRLVATPRSEETTTFGLGTGAGTLALALRFDDSGRILVRDQGRSAGRRDLRYRPGTPELIEATLSEPDSLATIYVTESAASRSC